MLNHQTIYHLITNHQLITHYKNLETQLQPTGFDLTLHHIETYTGPGTADYTNRERVTAPTTPLEPDPQGWYSLPPGPYKVVYNETVNMPLDLAALARTRSTLLRNGVAIATAVWDPGIAQLIFFKTDEVEKGYSGAYQNERNDPHPPQPI